MAEVYALFSGRDGVVRYIGETGGHAHVRFKYRDLWEQPNLHKWFHAEWLAGYRIEFVVLEACNYDVRKARETDWIARFPARDLLNERKVRWWRNSPSRPVVKKIVEYTRRYRFNAGGFRGIRRDSHWDCYQVLLYNGSGVEWLYGDECDEMMPGWGGNMYFPDRTAALIARDNARR